VDGAPAAVGQAVHRGSVVEAPAGTRASLVLADGTEVRLDRQASVALLDRRSLEVRAGRVWSRVVAGDPFVVRAGATQVTVLGTELSIDRTPQRTEVQLFSGKARVEAAGAVRDLAAGQATVFQDGKLSDARRIYSEAIATGWMLELYARSGHHERDLADHMDRLLAEMGRRKAVTIDEQTLVTELGGTCRVPLARFLVSEPAQLELSARRKAARVLESIADASVAEPLAKALRDPDPEVRVSAARALARISGDRFCPDPEKFRASCDATLAEEVDAWVKAGTPPTKGK